MSLFYPKKEERLDKLEEISEENKVKIEKLYEEIKALDGKIEELKKKVEEMTIVYPEKREWLREVQLRTLVVLQKLEGASLSTVAHRLGLNETYVKGVLDQLIELGLVTSEDRGGEIYYRSK